MKMSAGPSAKAGAACASRASRVSAVEGFMVWDSIIRKMSGRRPPLVADIQCPPPRAPARYGPFRARARQAVRPGETRMVTHRVVIIGGGFGGLYAAQRLRKVNVEITL